MMFEFAHASDTGLVRDNNEDSVGCDATHGVAVLADGMGGYNAGEIASAMAVTFVRTEMAQWLQTLRTPAPSADMRRALEVCVGNANIAIFNAAQSNPQFAGMGTTLVVGVFEAGRATVGHVGDSRCYLWRRQTLTQLTKDHSLLQEQIEAGLISPEQAKVATHRNLVTRALGVEESIRVDVLEHHPMADDIYLMCSDGLTDMVEDQAIAHSLAGDHRLAEKANRLVRLANAAGGRDNISVILVQAKAKSAGAPFFARLFRQTP